ncbi:MAG TPA: ATP-binding protein, partial [Gemmatimonadaceae bacterium]|nr:ATP-binding protein [Gemmatimonadaceae bacterium]
PVEGWPTSLRTAAGIVLAAPLGTILLWGPELVQIYNDAYRQVMGAKHPRGLGQRNIDCWPEAWDFTGPVYEAVMERGESLAFTDQRLVLERRGRPEETFFTLTYSPIPDDRGQVGGIFVTVVETTTQVRVREIVESGQIEAALRANEARNRFLLELNDRIAPLGDPEAVQLEAARLLGEHLGADRAGYAEILPDGETSVVTRNYTSGVPSIEGRHRVADYAPTLLAALGSGRTVVRADVASDPAFSAAEKAAHAALEIGATADIPLVRDGRLTAVMFVHYRGPHAWTEDELSLISAVVGRTWDAVERSRAEAALRESEAKYRTLFESMDEGFCVIEVLFDDTGRAADYRFVEANRAFLRQTGLRDAVGRRIRELVPDQDAHWFEVYGRVALTGEPQRFEAPAEALGRWYDVYAFRIGEPDERRVAILFDDISARKRAEAERERALAAAQSARAEAEGASRAKGEFLAVMSHELRTPLNAIGGYAELIELGLHGPVTEQQRADLARIQASQRHLLGLINQILNYTRVDAGAVRYDLTDIVAAEALAAAEALVVPQIRARGLTYVLDTCSREMRLRADREKVQQILLNLLSNAIKFTDPGGEVRVACTDAGRMVAIAVSDTGVGIDHDKLLHIFEPFVQVDQRLTRPHDGLGLGLAISRDLARGMGGDLTVESAPAMGSTFTLSLPRAG